MLVAAVEMVVAQLVEERNKRQTGSEAVVPTDSGCSGVVVEQLAVLATEID